MTSDEIRNNRGFAMYEAIRQGTASLDDISECAERMYSLLKDIIGEIDEEENERKAPNTFIIRKGFSGHLLVGYSVKRGKRLIPRQPNDGD